MMIELQSWMQTFLQLLNTTFAERVWFAGLQGSYARGEATETSDIDLVVILDQLTPADIQSYHTILDRMPHREKNLRLSLRKEGNSELGTGGSLPVLL